MAWYSRRTLMVIAVLMLSMIGGPLGLVSADAADPPPLDTVALATNSHVVRPGNHSVVFRLAQTHSDYQDHAIVVVRNHLGQRVWRETGHLEDPCNTDGGCQEFELFWRGVSNGGVLQPPGVYRAYGYLVDKWNRTIKVALGPVVIQKLVTKSVTTKRLNPVADDLLAPAYDKVGACSRSREVSGLVLESMVLDCPTPQPGDDRVWIGIQRGFHESGLTIDDVKFARLVKVRLQVYGEATSPGSTLTTSVQNTRGHNADIFVRLANQLPGTQGWHPTGWLTADPALLGTRHDPAFRLQATNASTYHVRFLKADFVYRAWANP